MSSLHYCPWRCAQFAFSSSCNHVGIRNVSSTHLLKHVDILSVSHLKKYSLGHSVFKEIPKPDFEKVFLDCGFRKGMFDFLEMTHTCFCTCSIQIRTTQLLNCFWNVPVSLSRKDEYENSMFATDSLDNLHCRKIGRAQNYISEKT